MEKIKLLFDYQRFSPNKKLTQQIEETYARCLAGGRHIPDEELDIAAAGDPYSWMDEVEKDDIF